MPHTQVKIPIWEAFDCAGSFMRPTEPWETPGISHVGLFSLLSSQLLGISEHQLSQTCWAGAHRPAAHNLPKSHYQISGFSKTATGTLRPETLPPWGFNTSLADATKLHDTDTHRHGDEVHTEKWSGALLLENKQQQETGRRERDTQTQGSSASLSLPSPCWAWQLSAGSRSICLSLRLSDTQSTWFLTPLSPEVIANGTTAISHYGDSN